MGSGNRASSALLRPQAATAYRMPMAVPFDNELPLTSGAHTSDRAAEAAAVVGATGLVGSLLLSADGIESGPVICPFRIATGLPCPGCGLTRSWVYLAHGRWTESLLAHPFGVVAAALVVVLIATVVRARIRDQNPPELPRIVRRPWFVWLVAMWVAFAAGRLAFAIAA